MSTRTLSTQNKRISRILSRAKSFFRHAKKVIFSLQTLVSLSGTLLILILFTAAIMPVRYDISVGMVPTHTITANRDIVDEITTEQLRKAAENAVKPTYYYSADVAEGVIERFDVIYKQMDAAVQYSEMLEDHGPTRRYTADEFAYARTLLTELSLPDYQLRTLLNTELSDLTALYTTLNAALHNAMNGSIAEGKESDAVNNILQIVGYAYREQTSLLQNVVQPLLKAVVAPNMIIDQEATSAARQLARDSIEPVVYKQGQNIVVKGEGRVERYQYEMLSSLGLLSSAKTDISIYAGGALIVLLTMCSALVFIRLSDERIAHDTKWLILLLSTIAISLACCILARIVSIYLSPVVLGAMLIAATIGYRPAFIVNIVLAILVSTLAAGGSTSYTGEMVYMLTSSLCSGSLVILMLSKRTTRLRIIGTSIAAALCNCLVMLALELMTSSTGGILTMDVLWMFCGAILSGLLCVAIQPLLEALFNLPTPSKLMELSNPNHPLLRRLLLEAPGTYHHSIVVANLAEAAAEAIGANPLLARVGGYYHDVGKLRRPVYFKENQLGGINKLNETDPYTAAQIVLSHTRDGVTLARNYRLPREILRIIAEHHGNTPVMYFYAMAVRDAKNQPVDVADYRYDAAPPSTKEGAIILLCDTIEAAVRSMQNPTPSAIEDFIVKLIRGKLQDGQLSNSSLTLNDIDAICRASATVLNGVFHERIEYPEMPADHIPAAVSNPTSAPTEPIDKTVVQRNGPIDDRTKSLFVAPPAAEAAVVHTAGDEQRALSPQQFIVDPSQFEADNPLPLVEPPVPETLPSIDEVLVRTDTDDPSAIAADQHSKDVTGSIDASSVAIDTLLSSNEAEELN